MLPATRYGSSLSGFSRAALFSREYAVVGALGQIRVALSISSWLSQGAASDTAATSATVAPARMPRRPTLGPVMRERHKGADGADSPKAYAASDTTRRGASAQARPSSANAGAPRPANSQNQSNEPCTTQ